MAVAATPPPPWAVAVPSRGPDGRSRLRRRPLGRGIVAAGVLVAGAVSCINQPGEVLWGFYAADNSTSVGAAVEAAVGRPFAILKYYSDTTMEHFLPQDQLDRAASTGAVIHVGWESDVWGRIPPGFPLTGATAPAGNVVYTDRQVATGQLDGYLDWAAERVKAWGRPVIIDYDHEADAGGSAANAATQGDPTSYVQAFRHVVERFRGRGVTNVQWAWVVAGEEEVPDEWYRALYPGDDVVDWVGWDAYNHDPARWRTPYDSFAPFYHRLERLGIGAGKPWMLAEYGCVPDVRQAEWFRDVPGALLALPRIRAVEYFSQGVWGAFELGTPAALAFAEAGRHPWVSPR